MDCLPGQTICQMTSDYAICCGFDQSFKLKVMSMCDAHLLSFINNANTKAKMYPKRVSPMTLILVTKQKQDK